MPFGPARTTLYRLCVNFNSYKGHLLTITTVSSFYENTPKAKCQVRCCIWLRRCNSLIAPCHCCYERLKTQLVNDIVEEEASLFSDGNTKRGKPVGNLQRFKDHCCNCGITYLELNSSACGMFSTQICLIYITFWLYNWWKVLFKQQLLMFNFFPLSISFNNLGAFWNDKMPATMTWSHKSSILYVRANQTAVREVLFAACLAIYNRYW